MTPSQILQFPKPDRRSKAERLAQEAVYTIWGLIEDAMDELPEADDPKEDHRARTSLMMRCLELTIIASAHAMVGHDNPGEDPATEVVYSYFGAILDGLSKGSAA
jgi:hypothetical protein